MHHRLMTLMTVLLYSTVAHAADEITQAEIIEAVLTPEPIKFEYKPQVTLPQVSALETAQAETVIEQNGSLSARINQALINKDWAMIESLLLEYEQSEEYDAVFADYALGAMLRSQGDYKQAIGRFERLLARQPELIYPYFDYAIMLYENKQYHQSRTAFEAIRPKLPESLHGLVDQYLKSIHDIQKVNWRYDLQYEKTDNVNNASSSPTVTVGSWVMTRTEDSLPKSANGIRYDLGINQIKNISGNHYWYNDAGINGVHYWDAREFSEMAITFNSGYFYQDFKRQFQLTPMVSYNLVGGDPYSFQYGLSTRYQQPLTPKLRLSLNALHYQKRYKDKSVANRYDGYLNAESVYLMWNKSPKLLLTGGIELNQDNTLDRSENSRKQGLMFGVTWIGNEWGARINTRFAVRQFEHEHYLFDQTRRDEEQRYGLTVWHDKIAYKGWQPKLNYQYYKIDSNIPDLYSRHSGEIFVSIDRKY